jgi:hypothetical protein
MKKTVISHAAFGGATALLASCVTYLASSVQPVRYLVIQISDPTKPQTVPE